MQDGDEKPENLELLGRELVEQEPEHEVARLVLGNAQRREEGLVLDPRHERVLELSQELLHQREGVPQAILGKGGVPDLPELLLARLSLLEQAQVGELVQEERVDLIDLVAVHCAEGVRHGRVLSIHSVQNVLQNLRGQEQSRRVVGGQALAALASQQGSVDPLRELAAEGLEGNELSVQPYAVHGYSGGSRLGALQSVLASFSSRGVFEQHQSEAAPDPGIPLSLRSSPVSGLAAAGPLPGPSLRLPDPSCAPPLDCWEINALFSSVTSPFKLFKAQTGEINSCRRNINFLKASASPLQRSIQFAVLQNRRKQLREEEASARERDRASALGMEGPTPTHRGSLKSLNLWQKERRLKALEGVRKRRSDARDAELALRRGEPAGRPEEPRADADVGSESSEAARRDGEAGANPDQEMRERKKAGLRARHRKKFASQLTIMEWLIDVPDDLYTNWYVLPRPEGPRCLLIAQNGITTSRYKNGNLHKKFESSLPNGSTETGTSSAKCVLDAVFHAPLKTFFVTDCMVWEDYSLVDCDFEFRRYWLNQKMSALADGEASPAAASASSGGFTVAVIPAEVSTRETLLRAYGEAFGYTKDGLVFVHKDSSYTQGEITPLCLQWKDGSCSRYPIDTDKQGKVLEAQAVVLRLGEDGRTLWTDDSPPLALGAIPAAFAGQNQETLRPGQLFKFALGPGGLRLAEDGRPEGANLVLRGLAHNRASADTVSRILFQHLARSEKNALGSLLGGAQDLGMTIGMES